MAGVGALHHAMALFATPLLAPAMRAQPLPGDVVWLFQIAAGDDGAIGRAVDATGAPSDRVRLAAALYIQHVVFAPDADHYRVLGVTRDAPQEQIREHFGWLMKWLHPDRLGSGWEAKFAQRVVAAWNDLKLPDKRAAYDRLLPADGGVLTPSGRRRRLTRVPRGVPLIHHRASSKRARLARVALYLIAGMVVALVLLSPWRLGPLVDAEADTVTDARP